MASFLPQEIVDAVLICLNSDEGRPALQSCAMVCREWNSVARPHLFREITVNGEDDVYSLLDLLEDAPGIGLVVQDLIVKGGTVYGGPFFLELVAESLPSVLPNLTSLTWSWLTLTHYSPPISTHLLNFKKVTHLRIRRCTCPVQTLWAYISALPSLQELSISDHQSFQKRSDDRVTGEINPTSRLTTLVLIRSEQIRTFLELITESPWVQSIQSLTTIANDWTSLWVSDILLAIGPSLTQMDLLLRVYYSIQAHPDRLNLNANTNLRDLTLRVFAIDDTLIHTIISRLTLEHLQSLHIHIDHFHESHLDPFRNVLRSLREACLPSLRIVKFFANPQCYDEMLQSLKQDLDEFNVGGCSMTVALVPDSQMY